MKIKTENQTICDEVEIAPRFALKLENFCKN